MKRLLLHAVAFAVLLLGASVSPADQMPQRVPTYPYEGLYTPPEAVSAAVGGPGVMLSDAAKATVVYEYSGGGPCGANYDSSGCATSVSSGRTLGMGIWLPVGIGAAVAGLGLVGYWLPVARV